MYIFSNSYRRSFLLIVSRNKSAVFRFLSLKNQKGPILFRTRPMRKIPLGWLFVELSSMRRLNTEIFRF